MQNKNTSKKVRVVGTKRYINPETGEFEDMQVTSIEERDFNFTKVWMQSFISSLELVGNKKLKIAFWIIDNLTKENLLTKTYRQIAESTNTSLETVSQTMQILLEVDFIRRINQGCYQINPNILFNGPRNARLNVLQTYTSTAHITPKTKKEKLADVDAAIKELNATRASILAEPDIEVTADGVTTETVPLLAEVS